MFLLEVVLVYVMFQTMITNKIQESGIHLFLINRLFNYKIFQPNIYIFKKP